MTEYFLFSNPSFLSGMSCVLDLGGTLNEYNVSATNEQADSLAIRSDWAVVGADIMEAVTSDDQKI